MAAVPALSTAWSKSHKEDAHAFSFLDLPRELRDLIYSYTFHVSGAIFIYTKDPYQPERKIRSKIVRYKNIGAPEPQSVYKHVSTGLLQTCRQLHAETAPVLYGDNIFRIWIINRMNLAPEYRQLVRRIVLTAEASHRIFGPRDLDAVNHGWKHRFWPSILDGGEKTLALFPNVENITVSMNIGEAPGWKPLFFAMGGETAERRIELAAEWMLKKSPLADERLRDCLHLELVPPLGSISREEYAGSRFAPDEDDWDYTEFENAFELMKTLD
jgi:hypothetical protein